MDHFSALQKPLCYHDLKSCENLICCTNCGCAWYSSSEAKGLHSANHSKVCSVPDINEIRNYTLEQCCEILMSTFSDHSKFDHNTAAVLAHFKHLALKEGERPRQKRSETGKNLNDIGFQLKEKLREMFFKSPCYEDILNHLWACPGFPQYLLLGDLRSLTFHGLKAKFPEGRPVFNNIHDEKVFDEKFNAHLDTSGEWSGFLILQLLVFTSCTPEKATDEGICDGIGQLRNTSNAKAARLRITEILSSPVMRTSLKEALYSVPGLVYNITKNDEQEIVMMLEQGAFSGVLEMADQDYALNTLEELGMHNLSGLSKSSIVSIIKECCSAIEKPVWIFVNSTLDKKIKSACKNIVASLICQHYSSIVSILELGMQHKKEKIHWVKTDIFGYDRLILSFFLGKILESSGNHVNNDIILRWLDEWGLLKDRSKYAEIVMDEDTLKCWTSFYE